jgi:type IV secretory pathway TrbD component
MTDKLQQRRRTNRVFKSLHKPLTYLGVERTLFYFVCVSAVGAFNLFNSILAGIAVFIGGFAFGHWVTNSDPAFLRILAKSERYIIPKIMDSGYVELGKKRMEFTRKGSPS